MTPTLLLGSQLRTMQMEWDQFPYIKRSWTPIYHTTFFCKGVHWPYASAIAKTLEERDYEIIVGLTKKGLCPDDPDFIFRVTIKDGADGMGSVSIYKEKLDSYLPDNAFL